MIRHYRLNSEDRKRGRDLLTNLVTGVRSKSLGEYAAFESISSNSFTYLGSSVVTWVVCGYCSF